jgi:hypothetical protein
MFGKWDGFGAFKNPVLILSHRAPADCWRSAQACLRRLKPLLRAKNDKNAM